MPLAAGLFLCGAFILLAFYGSLRAIRVRSSKLVPHSKRENYTHTPAFWEHVFGKRRVKRLTYRADAPDRVL
jgi:hypothetical protein